MKITDRIIKELSLRKPQELSLVKLDTLLSSFKIGKETPEEIEAKLVGNLKFDTEFPSFAFALATGVGKTRLMGGMIAYLYHAKGLKDFFILTPGETIYTKTIDNFTPSSKKYVLAGLTDFPIFNLVTGENYQYADFGNKLFDSINIYIFNIQKIFNERKDVEFRFHKYQETLGSSFAELLQQKDLVILMDESHRYRGEKSLRAINHLKPELGLEFTATPSSDNVVHTYSLSDAIKDAKESLEKLKNGGTPDEGYIKIPYVVARSDNYAYKGDLEQAKLEDGIQLHREKKALIEEYCKNNKVPFILPITLITTSDIDHAKRIQLEIKKDSFFDGYYKDKSLVVTSESEVDAINQLLHLEEPYPVNKIEIVIHVDKLKEGWDVRNVYTIIPFRASISKTLIEQTIGRGLRLPFGQLTGVEQLDSLDIISHDNYSRVLSLAHEVAESIEGKKIGKQEELKPVEIKPTEDNKFWIMIPKVDTKVEASNKLKFFPIQVKLEELKKITPQLIKTDIVTKESALVAQVRSLQEINPVNRIVRLLIRDLTEIDISYKEVLQKIVKYYLDQLNVDKEDLPALVWLHEQRILDDIKPQIQAKFLEQVKIDFEVLDDEIGYEPYVKSIKVSAVPLNKDTVEGSEARGNIIGGYEKSTYPAYVFDSLPEKLFADMLEKEPKVKAWLRLRLGQLPIRYVSGNYNPDFIVETSEGIYVIEVKSEKELETPEVLDKARYGKTWCEAVAKATKKNWIYKLLPHTAIETLHSFDAIISSAYKYSEEN